MAAWPASEEQSASGLTPKLAYAAWRKTRFGIRADLGLLWDAEKGFRAAANLRFLSTQLIWANGTHEIAIIWT